MLDPVVVEGFIGGESRPKSILGVGILKQFFILHDLEFGSFANELASKTMKRRLKVDAYGLLLVAVPLKLDRLEVLSSEVERCHSVQLRNKKVWY